LLLMASLNTLMQGGYVEIHRGAWRVHGVLSVSRSIGDAHLKDWVLAEPDTKILKLTPDMEFLVLASDGLWEEVRGKVGEVYA
jgi:protein phosphatase 1L